MTLGLVRLSVKRFPCCHRFLQVQPCAHMYCQSGRCAHSTLTQVVTKRVFEIDLWTNVNFYIHCRRSNPFVILKQSFSFLRALDCLLRRQPCLLSSSSEHLAPEKITSAGQSHERSASPQVHPHQAWCTPETAHPTRLDITTFSRLLYAVVRNLEI